MNKIAVIVAGGSGTRMGNDLPKQFIQIKGKPILYYTIKTFLDAFDDMEIVLVVPEAYSHLAQEIIDAYLDTDRIQTVVGGSNRFESVQNGLSKIDKESIVFVHDAVRCLVTKDLIQKCYNTAMEMGTAIPVISCNDSVRILEEDNSEVMDRNKIVFVQTPQVFHSKILLPAFQIDHKDWFTDEATVVESFGMKVTLVEGERTNIKITTPIDLIIAEAQI